MALRHAELFQTPRVTARLLPTPCQGFVGKGRHGRGKPPRLVEVRFLEPAPGFDEANQVEFEGLHPASVQHPQQPFAFFGRMPGEQAGKRRERGFVRISRRFRADDVATRHVHVAQAADFASQPASLLGKPAEFRTTSHVVKDGEPAAQAAQSDPELVRPFHVVRIAHDIDVGADLVRAFAHDVARRRLDRHIAGQRHVDGVARCRQGRDAAFRCEKFRPGGFGQTREAQSAVRIECVRDVEQCPWAAFDPLDLEFVPGSGGAPGGDGAPIRRYLDPRTVGQCNYSARPLEAHVGDDDQLLALAEVDDAGSQRLVGDGIQVGCPASYDRFGFLHVGEAAERLAAGLDRLQGPPAVTPRPQRDAGIAQRAVGRIVVEGRESSRMRRGEGTIEDLHPGPQSCGRLREHEFEFHLPHGE